MLGTRHRIRQRADRAFVLLSMSALLAFAFFPAVSNAEDSSGIQYSDAPPTVPGKETRDSLGNSSSSGRETDGSGQSSTRSGSTKGGKSGGRSSGDESGGAAAGGGKGGSGSNSGEQRGDTGGQPLKAIDATPTSDDGGSSPLIAILIAIAVLAAISIGAVAMRRRGRDSDPGASVSPEAS